jgi:class 3 adenylate cyclase
MPEPIRKLAAIVFTDIVGFTKITAEDQSKASSLLKTQRELFQPLVAQFNGSWIKEMGDGLILTFETVTDAVNCCIKC